MYALIASARMFTKVGIDMTILYSYLFAVAPSVTDAVAVLDAPNQCRDVHSITVTCTIHPESEAELCEVVLIATGNLTRTGKQNKLHI